MQVQRRFIVTGWKRVAGEVIPTHGHYIGAGNRSVTSIQRKLQVNLIHNLRRAADGRFNWWLSLDRIAATNAADETPSRQVRRAQERRAARSYCTKHKNRRGSWRTMLLYPELVNAS